MNKIFTLSIGLALAVSSSFGQIQRMVLSEEFTNASCGPCASQNPAYNALMDANTTKIISIKYQTDWPGVDPMNAQNPGQVDTLVTQYGVTGVPFAPLDGDTNITGASYTGAPANYSQSLVDTRYNVDAHWTMNLSHVISSDLDSIYITCVVTPDSTNPSISNLKLKIALVEKEIVFFAAPGSNGETEFYNVMRKMYPSAAGQNLAGIQALGQPFTYTVAAKLPSYIYDIGQVGVIAFIQNSVHAGTSKNVEQAAMSQPTPLSLDGAVFSLALPTDDYFCGTTYTPTVTLRNPGLTTITSAVINYTINGGTPQTFNYTGSIANGATATISLPSQNTAAGINTFSATIVSENGSTDINPGNNTMSSSFVNYSAASSGALGFQQKFTTDPMVSGYKIVNPNNGATWFYFNNAGFGTPKGCMVMPFYSSGDGQVDEFVLPPLSTTGATAAKLSFKHSYRRYDANTEDAVGVEFSTDCGSTWQSIWSKSGDSLKTVATNSTASFVPTNDGQWKSNEIQLPSAFLNKAAVIIKFVGTSNYGNNAFIDDINITSNVSINDFSNENSLSVYPNPFNESTTLKLNISKSENVSYNIVNTMGAIVGSENKGKLQAGESIINIDGSNLATGIYLMNVTVGNKTYSQKLNIVK